MKIVWKLSLNFKIETIYPTDAEFLISQTTSTRNIVATF